MNTLFSKFIAPTKGTSSRRLSPNRRRAHLTVECVEGRMLMSAAQVTAPSVKPAAVTVVDGTINGVTLGTVVETAQADSKTIQVGEKSSWPTTFPFYATIGNELVQVTGMSSSNNLNNLLNNDYTVNVKRGLSSYGTTSHAVGTPIFGYVPSSATSTPTPTPTPTRQLSAPQNFTAKAVSSSQINLSWSAVEGANSYTLYWWNGKSWASFATTTATSRPATGLSADTTNYFEVAANNSAGTGAPSAMQSATTFEALGIPTSAATVVTLSQVNLS